MANLIARRTTPGLLLRAVLYWLPLALAISATAALVYVAVQQDFRQNANDPQIQMAEDAALQLEAGKTAQVVVGDTKVDMARSLASFLIVYSDSGQPLAASVQLNGQTPALPQGVFESVRQMGEDRLTWQPQPGVRSATVVTHFGGSHPGFVLAGRSLREVELRESQLTQEVSLAWVAAMAGSLAVWVLVLWVVGRFLTGRDSV